MNLSRTLQSKNLTLLWRLFNKILYFRKMRIFLCLLLTTSCIWAQRLSERRIARQLTKIPAFSHSFIALAVAPLEGGAPSGLHADHYTTPASTTKLLTFLGALQTFDSLPALEYAEAQDSLFYFRTTGYPLLFHPFYPDSLLSAFLHSKKQLVYQPPKLQPKPWGPGWSWDDYSYYYAAEHSAFPIYGNTVQAVASNQGLRLLPEFPLTLQPSGPALERKLDSNRFNAQLAQWKVGDTLYRPFKTSDTLFVRLLEQAIDREVLLDTTARSELEWQYLYTHQEERLYQGLLQDSDNGLAESLLLMIAQAQGQGLNPEAAIAALNTSWKAWLPDPLVWVDGSGVSRYNMLTPRTLVAVLQKIEAQIGWESLQKLFPQSGVSGTLKAYPDLEGVYGKTGTLRHNHNLSGYWESPKGNRYVFALMVNHYTASTSEIRAGITSLLQWLQKKFK